MGWVISILISESFNETRIDKKMEFYIVKQVFHLNLTMTVTSSHCNINSWRFKHLTSNDDTYSVLHLLGLCLVLISFFLKLFQFSFQLLQLILWIKSYENYLKHSLNLMSQFKFLWHNSRGVTLAVFSYRKFFHILS